MAKANKEKIIKEKEDKVAARLKELEEKLDPYMITMANHMAEGFSQYASLQKAKPDSKYKSFESGRSTASQLIRYNPEIREYADLLVQIANIQTAYRLFASAMDKRQMLMETIERCSQKGKNFLPRAVIAAITELNKMDGDVAPIETKVTQTSINRNVNYETVTPQEASTAYQDMLKESKAS